MDKKDLLLVSSNEDIEERLEQEQLQKSVEEEQKTVDVLTRDYIKIEREKAELQEKIEDFKALHPEIFNTLEGIEGEIKELEEEQLGIKTKLLDKLEEKVEILGYSFVKVITEVKRTFDSKAFYNDYLHTSRLYKKYVTESAVLPYIKVTKLKKKKDK